MKLVKDKWHSARQYVKKNERILFPASLIVGFIIDALTLNRVDQWFDNLVVLFYIILAGTSILLIYIKQSLAEKIPGYWKIQSFLPLIMQFAFGSLFSALIIFYSKSTSLLTNGAFLGALVVLFVGNEFFHNRYPRLIFQVAVFYIALLSYSLLITPVLVGEISTAVFVVGTAISIVVIAVYLQILLHLLPISFRAHVSPIHITLTGILAGFYLLYFTNVIPPIPLALKDTGIYHSISRSSTGEYQVTLEEPRWFEPFRSSSKTFHRLPGEPVYAFSAVFAPSKISSTIYHEWSYFNEEELRWISIGRFPLTISGGRDDGYRGFSFNNQVFPGSWRVDVETKRGQIIGRMKFNLENIQSEGQRDPLIRKVY